MAEENKVQALLDKKISEDADFQATLADMSEEDQAQAITDKKAELIEAEFSALSEQKTKAEELARNQKVRAEKAEQEARKNKPVGDGSTPKKESEYSLQDIRALSDVHDDDVAEVVEFAKFKGISIAEAKKHPVIQNILSVNKEFRSTEAAKNSGKGKPGASRTTDAQLVEQAASGQLPDDDEGITRLAEARQAEKLAKLQK